MYQSPNQSAICSLLVVALELCELLARAVLGVKPIYGHAQMKNVKYMYKGEKIKATSKIMIRCNRY